MQPSSITKFGRRPLACEFLEEKRLLAYTTAVLPLPDSTFFIEWLGDSAADTLTFTVDANGFLRHNRQSDPGFEDDLDLDSGPSTVRLQLTAISQIDVTAGGGNDVLRIDHSGGAILDVVQFRFDGGSGDDLLQGPDTGLNWNVTGDLTGSAQKTSSDRVLIFENTEQLQGGVSPDRFLLERGGNIRTIFGGGGPDLLQGANGRANLFELSNVNVGQLVGAVDRFESMENLVGGNGADEFRFLSGGALQGIVDGRQGNNLLNFADLTTPQNIQLTTSTLVGFGGVDLQTPNRRLASFDNVTRLLGSASPADELKGIDLDSRWFIDDLTGDRVEQGGASLEFEGFEKLQGGSSDDDFYVIRTLVAANSRQLDGRLGRDTFFIGRSQDVGLSLGLDHVLHAVIVDGGADVASDQDQLVVWDQNDTSDNSYRLLTQSAARNSTTIVEFRRIETFDLLAGLRNDTIQVGAMPSVSRVNIIGGTGDDVVNITSTDAGTQTTVDMGSGSDEIRISSLAPILEGDLDDILGPIHIFGGGTRPISIDLNRDGRTDILDLNILAEAIRGNVTNGIDLNRDGFIDVADLHLMATAGLGIRPGDTNLDRQVNFADFLELSANFSDAGTWTDGDFNGNGVVDFDDFLFLAENFQQPALDIDTGIDRLQISDRRGSTPNADVRVSPSRVTGFAGAADNVSIEFQFIEQIGLIGSDQSEAFHIENTETDVELTISGNNGDDAFVVENSGVSSHLILTGDAGDDLITIQSLRGELDATGGNDEDVFDVQSTGHTASLIRLRGGDQSDQFFVRGTSESSTLESLGEGGNDAFFLGRTRAGGNEDISGILGNVSIDGGSHTPSPLSSAALTIDGQTISVTTAQGDELSILDHDYRQPANYRLTSNEFDRDEVVARLKPFSDLETISVSTGQDDSVVHIESTPDRTAAQVLTQDANNFLVVENTGQASRLRADFGSESDSVQIVTTGPDSLVRLLSGAGNDEIAIQNTGQRAGVEWHGELGSDEAVLRGTGLGSLVLLTGGDEDDQIGVGPSWDPILGRVHIDGGGNALPIMEVRIAGGVVNSADSGGSDVVDFSSPPWIPPLTITEIISQVDQGDRLLVVDDQLPDETNDSIQEYELTDTVPPSTGAGPGTGRLSRIADRFLTFTAIEQLTLQTGATDDRLEVLLTPSSQYPSVVTFEADGGTDRFVVSGTSEDDTIIVGPVTSVDAVRSPYEVSNVESLELFGFAGDDFIRNDTGQFRDSAAPALIAGGLGNDVLIGSVLDDVMFGDRGADVLFGNLGNDSLFADVDPDGTIAAEAGDVVFGNLGQGNDPGFRDQAVLLVPPGSTVADFVDEVEQIIEEGAEKGVWSWLTATFAFFDLQQNADGTLRSNTISARVRSALDKFRQIV